MCVRERERERTNMCVLQQKGVDEKLIFQAKLEKKWKCFVGMIKSNLLRQTNKENKMRRIGRGGKPEAARKVKCQWQG